MAGWQRHEGQIIRLPLENVDTDQLIPARFMSVPRSQGYGPYLMHDLRRDAAGDLLPDFALNRARGSVLFAGRNFGSGSSREAAVYALVDAGFVAVVAPSFGDIFASNAVNNGLLPARLSADQIADLGAGETAQVDLATKTLTVGAVSARYDLDDTWREKLINGWDDIDLTLQHRERIAQYRANRAATPGAWPRAG